ncbi:putative baseplate assembly protein [Streptacidiphilus rugosus]|uniref:putative baseplate assembly protein n=1 Tax=Streptacidiphilus rugosus TaxID=405783 RepID=UPI000565B007|nr:putative baseplate assembly protein [Streptacidiphilus rugosus]
MALPAPNLDDRRFQDLVDDAKRMVQKRCPEWTDHNVSDPGVTLIETFAFMTDQLLYRLNRVPDRLYIKFLDLIGVQMLPPTPARVPLTFWLSAPARTTMPIGVGTRAGTVRTVSHDPIVFATVDELQIVPARLRHTRARFSDADEFTDPTSGRDKFTPYAAFSEVPQHEDALYLGFAEAMPQCTLRFDIDCTIDGVGVDPTHPPLRWQAWDGQDWVDCEVWEDETGGLNRKGKVLLSVPDSHEVSVIDSQRAGWLRAQIIYPDDEDVPRYSASPVIRGLYVTTVGGTVEAIQAALIKDEVLGETEGVPGQQFKLQHAPVLAGAGAPVLNVSSDDGWQEWQEVDSFATSSPDDRHFVLDSVTGTVLFGPALRQPDGTLHQYGAVPLVGSTVVMRRYSTGGGRQGNIARNSIRTLKTSIPFVSNVENRQPAQGGVDGETLEEAKARGPLTLRARSRAVTAEDYEAISREAAPETARVRCLTAGEHDVDAGSVKVLIVPAAASENHRIRFEDLVPAPDTLERITNRLNQVRLVGARVLVEPPRYQGITVVARIVARRNADIAQLREDALDGLYNFLNPLTGGHEGTGWPFGRDVQSGEIFAILQRIRGVDFIEDVRLFGANPVTGDRGAQTNRLTLEPNSLIFSFEHQVRIEEAP